MKIELKSCPFCGRDAVLRERIDEQHHYIIYGVECCNCDCGATAFYTSEQIAADVWNRRVDDSYNLGFGDGVRHTKKLVLDAIKEAKNEDY